MMVMMLTVTLMMRMVMMVTFILGMMVTKVII